LERYLGTFRRAGVDDSAQVVAVIREQADIVADPSPKFSSDQTAVRATMRADWWCPTPRPWCESAESFPNPSRPEYWDHFRARDPGGPFASTRHSRGPVGHRVCRAGPMPHRINSDQGRHLLTTAFNTFNASPDTRSVTSKLPGTSREDLRRRTALHDAGSQNPPR
jgi:hypothetical protein